MAQSCVFCRRLVGNSSDRPWGRRRPKKPIVEKITIPLDGVKEFTVTGRSTLFRITVSTIAGGTISEPKITGPAEHVRTAEISEVAKDGTLRIGTLTMEFVLRGTGAGIATIEFEKTRLRNRRLKARRMS